MKKTQIQLSDHFTYQKLLRFVLPSIVMMVFTSIYGVVDGLFVSNFAGKTPFAAINLVMPFIMVLGGIGFMIGTGGTALVSKVLGEGEPEKAKRYFTMMILFTLLVGAVLTVFGVTMMEKVARFFGATDEMLHDCVLYGRIVISFTAAFMLQNVFQSFLIAAEKPKLGLIATVAAGVTNMALDALFIAGFHWGVAGAAIATSLSQLICAAFVIRSLMRRQDEARLMPAKLRPTPALVKRMLLFGLPAGLQSVLYNVTNLYVQKAVNLMGTDTVAAWSIYAKIDGVFWPISNAFGIAIMTFVGQNYGARSRARIQESIRTGWLLHLGMAVFFSAVAVLSSPLTMRLFSSDPAVLAEARQFILHISSCYVLFSSVEVLSSAMRGVGNAVKPAVITFFAVCVLRMALLFTVTFPHLSVLTISICYPVTWAASSVLFILYYKFGRWMPRYPESAKSE